MPYRPLRHHAPALALVASLCLAPMTAVAGGPPTLPPPRDFSAAPSPEPEPQAPAESPSTATPAPTTTDPVAPTPAAAPANPLPTTTTSNEALPAPTQPPAAFNFGQPEVVEPPQPPPPASNPNAATSPNAGPSPGPKRNRAPLMDPSQGPGVIDQSLLPTIETPPKPDAKGTGAFVTSGVLFVAAIGEYIAAHSLLKKRCVRPLAGADLLGDEADQYVADCSITMLQAGALKLHGSINALASIGIAAAGASIRARYDAHHDVFESGRHKKTQPLRTAGASLLGVGLFTWLGSAVGTWAGTIACTELGCVERLRTAQNVLTLSSFALITSGTGMLTYGLLYERRYTENATIYGHIQRMQLLPTASRNHVGVSLVGRF